MIVAEFSLVPLGTGTSASHYIKAVQDMLRGAGMKFVPGPMSTSIEAESFTEIFELVEKANHVLSEMGAKRIITSLKLDYRLDKELSIQSKLSALER
jgi:uncharacterized protein (TIGR00106 family)